MKDPLSRKLVFALIALWLMIGLTDLAAFALPSLLGPSPGPIRVLIVYDAREQPVNAVEVLHYLNTHCIKSKNTPEWRQWNKDVDADNESKEFKAMLALSRSAMPWIVIENERGQRFSGSLPKSTEDQLSLLKQWGGA